MAPNEEPPTKIEVTDALERAWDLFMEEILVDPTLREAFVGGRLSPWHVTRLFDIALRAQDSPALVGVLPTLAGIRQALAEQDGPDE